MVMILCELQAKNEQILKFFLGKIQSWAAPHSDLRIEQSMCAVHGVNRTRLTPEFQIEALNLPTYRPSAPDRRCPHGATCP